MQPLIAVNLSINGLSYCFFSLFYKYNLNLLLESPDPEKNRAAVDSSIRDGNVQRLITLDPC